MKLKIAFVILLIFFAGSVALNFFLYKKQNLKISFEDIPSAEATPTVILIQTPAPTLSENSYTPTKIGQTFTIDLKNAEGESIEEIAYTLTEYELTKQITVNGQTATAVTGRQFLIINIQITNPLDRVIEINTKDYIRLSVNNSDNWTAPDIHNDPTEVQPISSKFTRVGFPINETDTGLSLQIGELNGKKDIINLQ